MEKMFRQILHANYKTPFIKMLEIKKYIEGSQSKILLSFLDFED